MWRALPFLGLAVLAFAQEFHHFSGRVVDENGRPIAEAFFDNTAMPESEYPERFTNREGIFDIWTSSELVVVRKINYRPIVLTAKDVSKREFIMVKEKKPSSTASPKALPSGRTITGRVTDEAGQPVAEAHIDYTGDDVNQFQTDVQGRFILATKAPAVIVRKPGYRSEFVRIASNTLVQITLHPEPGNFPICPGTTIPETAYGIDFDFRFPESKEVVSNRKGVDVDYSTRSYRATATRSSARIGFVTGAMWGGGTPAQSDVWNSVSYEEAIFQVGRVSITSARGEDAKGRRWRYIGRFSEEISYRDADPKTAAIFDKFLDSVCLASVN
jgi:hypothetical protein